jgi:hypothetical protein
MKIKTLPVFLFPLVMSAQSLDTVALHYSGLIKAATMSKDLHVLASDEYEGRETGKKGQKMAAAYIADQFKADGIPPYKDQTYYQPFTIDKLVNSPVFKQVPEIILTGKQFVSEKDYYLLQGRTEHQLKAEKILFLGYGIEETAYSDYRNVEVEGKVLMVLQGEPFAKDSTSLITGNKASSEWSTFYKKKIEKAYQKGASALLIVDPDFDEHLSAIKTKSAFIRLEKGKPEMAVFYISKSMAEAILKKNKIDKLSNKIKEKKKTVHKTVKSSLVISVKNVGEKINSENVLAYIEGTDLKDELIVISAHYDHLGKDGNVVYNGADDDGSGTSAILNLAKVFAIAKKEGHGPRRSVLCIAFAGEEKGLLGSDYYVDHPEYPLKNTICDLNIDMIGRIDDKYKGNPNYIYVIGSDKLSSELHLINETMNKTYCNLQLDYTYNDEKDKNRYYYRSDHYNFAKNGIPVIFYFNGVHADYHKETDEVEKIDFNKMEKITRLVFFTAWEIANKKERIVVDSNKK